VAEIGPFTMTCTECGQGVYLITAKSASLVQDAGDVQAKIVFEAAPCSACGHNLRTGHDDERDQPAN
jgi:hypothetical protein